MRPTSMEKVAAIIMEGWNSSIVTGDIDHNITVCRLYLMKLDGAKLMFDECGEMDVQSHLARDLASYKAAHNEMRDYLNRMYQARQTVNERVGRA